MAQAGLVVLVPEAERLVGPFRDRFDPSAATGMPAHVTLLFPFVAPEAMTLQLADELAALFAAHPAFDYAFGEPRRFPDTLYLPPEPDAPFRALTQAIWDRYPEAPPYGGAHAEIVPHLTIGHAAEPSALDAMAAEFEIAAVDRLPITGHAGGVTLVDNLSGRWEIRATFQFGS
jgi:2'-5' RNA ligase